MSIFYSSLKNILFLDIETAAGYPAYHLMPPALQKAWEHKASYVAPGLCPAEAYSQKAGIYAEFGKVITIGIGFMYEDKKQLFFKTKALANEHEQALLASFNLLLSRHYRNTKVLFCAHNGKEFDYPYLCRRMLTHRLALPAPLKIMGKKPWEISHLDTMEMWKFGDHKHYTSLELLCTLLDIPSSKSQLDGSKVNSVYYDRQGLSQIAAYCVEDVIATGQLYLRLHNKPLIEEERIIRI
jgi:predicted PolB exonuclease-like 3'-5' exonuclease